MTNHEIAAIIISARKAANMTQRELAERMGVTQNKINYYETASFKKFNQEIRDEFIRALELPKDAFDDSKAGIAEIVAWLNTTEGAQQIFQAMIDDGTVGRWLNSAEGFQAALNAHKNHASVSRVPECSQCRFMRGHDRS